MQGRSSAPVCRGCLVIETRVQNSLHILSMHTFWKSMRALDRHSPQCNGHISGSAGVTPKAEGIPCQVLTHALGPHCACGALHVAHMAAAPKTCARHRQAVYMCRLL